MAMVNCRDGSGFSRSTAHARSSESFGTLSLPTPGPTGTQKASSLPTPPGSARPSTEQPRRTSPVSSKDLGGSVDSTLQPERAIYHPATPPKTPPKRTEPQTLLSVIASVRDVLEGRQSQRMIKNVSPDLYKQLDARAKVDRDLVGWDSTRYVCLSILWFLSSDLIVFAGSISTMVFSSLAIQPAQVTKSSAICFTGLTGPTLTR